MTSLDMDIIQTPVLPRQGGQNGESEDRKEVDVEESGCREPTSVPTAPLNGRLDPTSMARSRLIILWSFFLLTSYVSGLYNFTVAVYMNFAAAKFGASVQFATLTIVQSMLVGLVKPPLARLSDCFGRAFVFTLATAFYIIGLAAAASASGIGGLAVGIAFSAMATGGITLAGQLMVADFVTPQWRGLVYYAVEFHFIINFAIGSRIAGALVKQNWRWGIGMFAILLPVVISPVIVIIWLEERKSMMKVAQQRVQVDVTLKVKLKTLVIDLDPAGLFCLTCGFLLLLLPLSIASRAPHGFQTGYIIAMFVLGALLLLLWPIVELKVPKPMVNLRTFFLNPNVIVPAMLYLLYEMSYTVGYTPVLQWFQIVFGWNVTNATYGYYAQTLSSVVFGVIGGAVAGYFKRYKWQMTTGACIRILGLGLMLKYRVPTSSPFQVMFPQVLAGVGDGFLSTCFVTAAQAAVPRDQIAIVTSFMMLSISLGASIGSAIAGAVQKHLLTLLHEYIDPITGNPEVAITIYAGGSTALAQYPLGTPVRTAILKAWTDNMKQILIGSISIGAVVLAATFLLPDKELSSSHFHKDENDKDDTVQKAGSGARAGR